MGQRWLLIRRRDLRDLPAVGEYCNPAVTQVLPEVLLPAEILGLVSMIALASGSRGLVPLVDVLARRSTSEGHWLVIQFHPGTPAAGEIAGKMGARGDSVVLRVCSQIPPWTPVVHVLLGPLRTPVSLCHLDMLALWGLQFLDHLWRKPKAHRQVPYPCQCLETNQQSARELSGSSWEVGAGN